MAKRKVSEVATLERYRVALENVVSQSEIARIMAEFGYESSLIEEGKNLYSETRQAYDLNVKEDDETSFSYSNFSGKRDLVADTYGLHRKKGKVIFRNDPQTLKKLVLDGTMPTTYVKWLETIKKFYSELLSDNELQTKISRLKVTADDLNAASALISELESARSEYMKEKGESQDATKQKDSTFAKLDDWMSEFYAVARIALEDNLQLLEALGVLVRN